MTQWDVVVVITALVGLGAAIVKPLIKLNTSITKLSTLLDGLAGDMRQLTEKNTKSHERIWDKLDEHEETVSDHETRITVLEKKDTHNR